MDDRGFDELILMNDVERNEEKSVERMLKSKNVKRSDERRMID